MRQLAGEPLNAGVTDHEIRSVDNQLSFISLLRGCEELVLCCPAKAVLWFLLEANKPCGHLWNADMAFSVLPLCCSISADISEGRVCSRPGLG